MSGTRNSSLLGKITVFVVIYCCTLPAQAKYGGGTGQPNDPYLIYTAEQMNEIGLSGNWDDWDKCFKLMADIDLSGFTGTSFNIIGTDRNNPFTGVFDGNGHTISNLTYTSTNKNCIGLFGYVTDSNAKITNLGLINPIVDAGTGFSVGSLVGWMFAGTISGCIVEGGSVSGRFGVGGLVGHKWHGLILNCYSTGSVSGTGSQVGGLVGFNGGNIENCCSVCTVEGATQVGGLVGRNFGGRVYTSCAKGNVSGDSQTGGLVGGNVHSGIENCYSTAEVMGSTDAGGLVGWNDFSDVSNCYSTGSVYGDDPNIGGLLGKNQGAVSGSYWDINTSGRTTSAGGMGKTTAQMQMASTFVGWGCEPVWTIDDSNDYPHLIWENRPGEIITHPLRLYGGGSGTATDPYLIYTADQLNTIGLVPCDWDNHFKLMADIDLSGYTSVEFNIIGRSINNAFTGTFEGNGYKISNFIHNSKNGVYTGLFGHVGGITGIVKDLGLVSVKVDAGMSDRVGSLIGGLSYGTLTGCYAEDVNVTGDISVGALLGYNWGGKIENCYATGTIVGYDMSGGLVGYSWGGKVENCYATSNVWGDTFVGGLLGYDESGTIIENCYVTAPVAGVFFTGGLVGHNFDGAISNCYAIGSVSGDYYTGGLVGYNYGIITNSYWDVETSNEPNMCGNEHEDCNNVYGRTTSQMQQQSTFQDWDFINVWNIGENQTYPYLRTVPAGDINKDRIVNLLDFAIIADQWLEEK